MEAVIEFISCKVIFLGYMHSFDADLGNDDEHLIMFYRSYLMFCLPYKVFGIIVLHSYSQFELDSPTTDGANGDCKFVSKHVNRSYLDEAESESHGTAADFDIEIEPLIGRKSDDGNAGVIVL